MGLNHHIALPCERERCSAASPLTSPRLITDHGPSERDLLRDILIKPFLAANYMHPHGGVSLYILGGAGHLITLISAELKKVGGKLILRKDTDEFTKSLKQAKTATFSVTDDGIKKNTSVQSAFAIGSQMKFAVGENLKDQFLFVFFPYMRENGSFNSNDRIKDVDILAFGLTASAYPIPTTPFLSSYISLRGEYLTDAENDKEVFGSELVWSPIAPKGTLAYPKSRTYRRFLFRRRGRLGFFRCSRACAIRFHRDAGGIATLGTGSEYMRVGVSASMDFKVGGEDIFSGLGAYAKYWYFSDTIDSAVISEFYKLEAGITYDLKPYYGFKLSYKKGRNEDTLQPLDKILASFTLKFGEIDNLPGEAGVE